MSSRGEQSAVRRARHAKPGSAIRRSVWFGSAAFVGVWSLGLIDIIERNANALPRTFIVSLAAATVVGGSAAILPLAWRVLLERVLAPLLGRSVEEPLNQAVCHPLMRALGLMFVAVGFIALWYAALFDNRGVVENLAFAAESGLWGAAGLLVLVSFWRVATRDRS